MQLLETGPSPRGWSRLQRAQQCLQKYAFTYEDESYERSTGSPALIKGSLIHLGLAHYYAQKKAIQEGSDPNKWLPPEAAIELSAMQKGDLWEKEVEASILTVKDYKARWHDENLKILEIERLAYVHIDKYLLTGRFDLVVEDSIGKVWVMDHKTTGRLTATQKKYYGVSGQLIGYHYIAKQIYGDRFGGVFLNQIQHRAPRKFVRTELPPAPNLLAKFPQIVSDTEERIQHMKDTGREYHDWPMAANELTCFHRYGACEFIEKCRWGTRKL